MSITLGTTAILIVVFGIFCWVFGFNAGLSQLKIAQEEARVRGFHAGLLNAAVEAEDVALQCLAEKDNSGAVVARTIRSVIEMNAVDVRCNVENDRVNFDGPAEGV